MCGGIPASSLADIKTNTELEVTQFEKNDESSGGISAINVLPENRPTSDGAMVPHGRSKNGGATMILSVKHNGISGKRSVKF